ncbi:MAG: ABC transporter permease [Proteobacteria bacterium]|nr:ABC transporter permease [Pseudomonadota bacterium]MBI3496310.1 ABC transporter permease [Pseudomonadota bacterium]
MNLKYILMRVIGAVPLIIGTSIVLFGVIHLAPGGPTDVYADNPSVTKEALEQIRTAYGLDRPIWAQYALWFGSMLRGDWGYSIRTGRPVFQDVVERLGPTFELGGLSLAISLSLALPLGVIGAARQNSPRDHALTLLSFSGISIPVFWLALLLQLLFSIVLGWLPSAGYQSIGDGSFGDRLAHIAMPVTVLSLATIASWSRYVRAGMLDVLHQEYIRTAYAKGQTEWGVLVHHALRNALLPAVTIIALDFASVISGAVITETVFAWPGIGRLFIESMDGRDYPVLMGLMLMGSMALILANLMADLVYAAIDPRIRYD